MYQYRNVKPAPYLGWRADIPIYVDQRFDKNQREDLIRAVEEWNHVLNGYLRIRVLTWDYKIGSPEATQISNSIERTQQGIVILSVKNDDPILALYKVDTALAFVDVIGDAAHVLVIIPERMGTRPWHMVLMHEFGHALGASHVNSPSLMFPITDGDLMINCADKITAAQIATYHHMNLEYLNYCPIPGFE